MTRRRLLTTRRPYTQSTDRALPAVSALHLTDDFMDLTAIARFLAAAVAGPFWERIADGPKSEQFCSQP